ncbi:hypothetical protein JHK84_027656 [Glycine max]|nr:hypothetical protein JHK84_027656 [Glycine max]
MVISLDTRGMLPELCFAARFRFLRKQRKKIRSRMKTFIFGKDYEIHFQLSNGALPEASYIQRKITLCLSPTSRVVQLGKVAHESQPGSKISRSLTLTGPLSCPPNKGHSQSDVRSLEAHLSHVHPDMCHLQILTTRRHPMVHRIIEADMPKGWKSLNLERYDGMTV